MRAMNIIEIPDIYKWRTWFVVGLARRLFATFVRVARVFYEQLESSLPCSLLNYLFQPTMAEDFRS